MKSYGSAQLLMNLKERAQQIKRDIMTLYFAFYHPKTPWYSKALIVFIIGYALSPIDLIPDFIPIFGYLDDVILLPLGINLIIRTLPEIALVECRRKACEYTGKRPASIAGAIVIVGIWLLLLTLAAKIVVALITSH